ncbi:TPA: hypothetical protein ACXE89_002354, partial [Pluralibacter gergoviae]
APPGRVYYLFSPQRRIPQYYSKAITLFISGLTLSFSHLCRNARQGCTGAHSTFFYRHLPYFYCFS